MTPQAPISEPLVPEPITTSELVAPVLCFALLMPVGLRVVLGIHGLADVATVVVAAWLGVVATDLTSGVVHYLCDNYFAEDTPVIGRALIEPFRRHHVDPNDILRGNVLHANRSNCFAMAAVLAAVALWHALEPGAPTSLLANGWLLGYSLAVVLTNQVHRWAHAAVVPQPVRWLQAHRLLLDPARHQRHHATHTSAFCITTGWLNPVFDRFVHTLHTGS